MLKNRTATSVENLRRWSIKALACSSSFICGFLLLMSACMLSAIILSLSGDNIRTDSIQGYSQGVLFWILLGVTAVSALAAGYFASKSGKDYGQNENSSKPRSIKYNTISVVFACVSIFSNIVMIICCISGLLNYYSQFGSAMWLAIILLLALSVPVISLFILGGSLLYGATWELCIKLLPTLMAGIALLLGAVAFQFNLIFNLF